MKESVPFLPSDTSRRKSIELHHINLGLSINQEEQEQSALINLDDVLNAVPFGKYHYLSCIALYLFFCAGAFINYNYGFFLLNPETEEDPEIIPKLYTCFPKDQSIEPFKCSYTEDVCANPERFSNVRDDQMDTLQNWIQRLNLYCADAFLIGLFGTLSFSGEVFAHVVHPPISDKYGRSFFNYLGGFYQLVLHIVILVSANYKWYLGAFPFFGMAVQIGQLLTYKLLMKQFLHQINQSYNYKVHS